MKKARKKTSKGKKSNAPKILLGLAAIGGAAYLGYKYWWLPRQAAKEQAPADRVDQPTSEQVLNTAIQNVDQAPANIAPAKLSPIGTPFNKINYNVTLFMGDKGAEVLYCQIMANKINAIRKALGYDYYSKNGKTTIAMDGIYGKNTYEMFKVLGFASKIGVTCKMATTNYNGWKYQINQMTMQNIQAAQNAQNNDTGSALGGVQ